MGNPEASTATSEKPRLLFFYSPRDGHARRVEGYLAQVLQRRQNHETFVVHRIEMSDRPDIAERFRVAPGPSLIVIEDRVIRARLDKPRNAKAIAELLDPWLH
jgi:thioredoxin-like negative regulator of GroEL